MTKRTYHIEHQRLSRDRGGYAECQPHQATRVAVIETTVVPAKHGSKRYFHRKLIDSFCGAGATARADDLCARLTRASKPRSMQNLLERAGRKIYARSLTIKEYDELTQRRRETGSY